MGKSLVSTVGMIGILAGSLTANGSAPGVARRPELVTETIPVQYALASDVAGVLVTLTTNQPLGSISATDLGVSSHVEERASTVSLSPFAARMTEVLRQAAHDGALSTPGLFEVKADERSNALLVTAAPGDMERVREIIAQLDVTLAQVLVEAAIIQIPVERRTHTQGPKAGAFPWELAALGTNIAGLVLLPGSTDDSQPKEQEGLRYLARLGVDLDTAVNMFATSRSVTNARILQRPRVQTSVGVPATLFVGQQVPYPVGSYTCGCPPARVDPGIGVAFETTPQLAPGGIVLLDVKQKVDMIITNVIIQNVGNVPVTASTTSEARLAVHDRETVLFGGVSVTNRISIFPEITGLNNVPIVGAALNRLIRAPKRTERVELLLLLRTTVLPTPEVAAQGQRAQKERMPAAARRL